MADPTNFVASNDYAIQHDKGRGRMLILDADGESSLESGDYLDAYDITALREYFVKEEHGRLGLGWLPQHPDYVLRRIPHSDDRDGRAVRVLYLPTFETETVWDRYPVTPRSAIEAAGVAWLAANPDPRPWEDAKPGEVWKISTVEGTVDTHAWRLDSGEFMFEDGALVFADGISAGERVWPKADA
ncbi:hypothetical protein [Microbacterium binotii]|uniref:Uncharacterized protein n=1 Tax=Microbacterium binotii TaxID=462710 RepID=A0ABN3PG73_9MICO